MKRSLSIIGLVFALVGMLAGTALAKAKRADLKPTGACTETDCDVGAGDVVVQEFRGKRLNIWYVEVHRMLLGTEYTLSTRDKDMTAACAGTPIVSFTTTDITESEPGEAVASAMTNVDAKDTVDVCRENPDDPTSALIHVLTAPVTTGRFPRR